MATDLRARRCRSVRKAALKAGLVGIAALLPLSLLQASGQAAPRLTIEQAQAQLSALQQKQDVAVEAFNNGTMAAQGAQRDVAVAERSVALQQRQVSAAQRKLAVFARAAYMNPGLDPVTSLLAGQSGSTIVQRVASLDQVARVRGSRATALQAQETRLAALQQVSADKLANATATQQRLDDAKNTVENLVAQQQSVLGRLQANQRRALQAQQARERAAALQAAAHQAAAFQASALAASAHPVSAPQAPAPQVIVAPAPHVDAPQAQAPQVTVPPAPPAPAAPQRAAPAPAAPSGGPAVAPGRGSSVAQTVIAAALSQRGKPYVYGAAGPNSYDCSGLVMWAYAQAGISLPHGATAVYNMGAHVSISQLRPGDIVAFSEGGPFYIGHDGIYLGNGMMIDANHTGGWVDVRSMQGYTGLVGGSRI